MLSHGQQLRPGEPEVSGRAADGEQPSLPRVGRGDADRGGRLVDLEAVRAGAGLGGAVRSEQGQTPQWSVEAPSGRRDEQDQ